MTDVSASTKKHTHQLTHKQEGVEQQPHLQRRRQLYFLTVHQRFCAGQLAAAELHCCLDCQPTNAHTHTKTHTDLRREALIQFHFLLELGQMPLSVSCITLTFIIYTPGESQKERERGREHECEAHKCKMRV